MKCYLLGFCYLEYELAGIAAIKRASRAYIYRLSDMSGLKEPIATRREAGWAYVKPEYRGRGISGALLDVAVSRYPWKAIFSVVGARDHISQRILFRSGFDRIGVDFIHGGRIRSLFIRSPTEGGGRDGSI